VSSCILQLLQQDAFDLDNSSQDKEIMKRKNPYILKRQLHVNKARRPYILKRSSYYWCSRRKQCIFSL